jgi:hypothetical protein
MLPVIEYLDSKQIQVDHEEPVADATGQLRSIDLVVVTPSGKATTLNVSLLVLAKRTAVQIGEYCEAADIAAQLEYSVLAVSIADFL